LGAPTSGATTLALHIVCQAQASRDCALYIDLDSTFDPAYAARCGVALDRLFLARPDTALQALDLARDLLVSGSVAALVLDVGRARPQPHLLRRLSAGLTRWGGLVLLLAWLENDIPAPDWPAALRLQVERMRWLVSGDDVVGYCARVTVLKGREGAQVEVEFRVDGGLPR
jgi:recombination protein RecA